MAKKKAIVAAAKEAALEAVKEIPFVGSLIEGVRAYHESIDEEQRQLFVDAMASRLDRLEQNSDWYKSSDGQEFVKKVVATGLNAEYADKIDYLANALTNGPSLGQQQAKRLKYVEMIRHLSKASLEVLATCVAHPTGTGQVMPGSIAKTLGWNPSFVDACVRELFASGAFSSVVDWFEHGEMAPRQRFNEGTTATTQVTREFAAFVSRGGE